MNFNHQGLSYKIERFPATSNKSLQAWNSADEHILKYLEEEQIESKELELVLYNDRFGFLSTLLAKQKPTTVLLYKSQEKSISANLKLNNINQEELTFQAPLDPFQNSKELALLKVPKSLELFELQLQHICISLKDSGFIICAFMTKYFSVNMLTIAGKYFEIVEQSKAWKKSRLLILKKKKKKVATPIINQISFQDSKIFQQYFGVFSSKNIDYASQFFIEHMRVTEEDACILDLACGNGILAYNAHLQKTNAELHLLDDSYLAIESARLNLGSNCHFHYANDLSSFKENTFDLIISNPPFHFEHETNIEVTLNLFSEVKRCLKAGGSFQMVTSHHLNLKTHLDALFHQVLIIAQNKKFVVYHCS